MLKVLEYYGAFLGKDGFMTVSKKKNAKKKVKINGILTLILLRYFNTSKQSKLL